MKPIKTQITPNALNNKKREQMNSNNNKDKLKQKSKQQKIKKQLIENFNKNLMKKLYNDLYNKNTSVYNQQDFTFENFIFYFYQDIISSLDYTNPNYNSLYNKIDLEIKSKFANDNKKTKIEPKRELNNLSQEDEWGLIFKYKLAIYNEEQEKLKREQLEKKKKYNRDLQAQIAQKQILIDLENKIKEDIYLYNDQARKQLEKLKIENQIKKDKIKEIVKEKDNDINNSLIQSKDIKTLKDENLTIVKENKKFIESKIDFLNKITTDENEKDEMISTLVDQIINNKKIDKINKVLHLSKHNHEQNNNQIKSQIKTQQPYALISPIEQKMHNELLEASKSYYKNNINLFK